MGVCNRVSRWVGSSTCHAHACVPSSVGARNCGRRTANQLVMSSFSPVLPSMEYAWYATFMVRLSKVTTITPGIIVSFGSGRCADASFMYFWTDISAKSAPFMRQEMESCSSRFIKCVRLAHDACG